MANQHRWITNDSDCIISYSHSWISVPLTYKKRLITAVAPLDLNLFGVNELVVLNRSVRLEKDPRLFTYNVLVGFADIAEGAI